VAFYLNGGLVFAALYLNGGLIHALRTSRHDALFVMSGLLQRIEIIYRIGFVIMMFNCRAFRLKGLL